MENNDQQLKRYLKTIAPDIDIKDLDAEKIHFLKNSHGFAWYKLNESILNLALSILDAFEEFRNKLLKRLK